MANYYDLALEAIQKVFVDTTKSQEAALQDLQSLRDEIDMRIQMIKADIRDQSHLAK